MIESSPGSWSPQRRTLMASFSSLHLGRTAEQKEIKELGRHWESIHVQHTTINCAHTCIQHWLMETIDCCSSIQMVYSASSTRYVIVHNNIEMAWKVSSDCLTNRVVNVAQCVGMIAQHPPCHVWPAFQAVECSSMQSWSPLDVSHPAPGLGEGEGSGGRSKRVEGGGRGEGKKGRGIEMKWESKWGRKEDKKQSLQ